MGNEATPQTALANGAQQNEEYQDFILRAPTLKRIFDALESEEFEEDVKQVIVDLGVSGY